MLTIERVNTMRPEWLEDFVEYAKQENALAVNLKTDIMKHSNCAWLLSKDGERLMLCGIVKGTWLGRGTELWVMLFKGFIRHKKIVLRFARRALPRLLKVQLALLVHVDKEFPKAKRFAEFFGFRYVQTVGKYDEYFMRASWLQQQ